MVDDDGFDDFIDMRLAGYRVLPIRDVHEGGPEADGQVVGIHHVLITVLGKARREQVPTVHPKGKSSPMLFLLWGKVGLHTNAGRWSYILIYHSSILKSLGTPLPGEARPVTEGSPGQVLTD